MVTRTYILLDGDTANGNYAGGEITTTGIRIEKSGKYLFEASGVWDGATLDPVSKQTGHSSFRTIDDCQLSTALGGVEIDLAEDEYVYGTLATVGATTAIYATLTLVEQY